MKQLIDVINSDDVTLHNQKIVAARKSTLAEESWIDFMTTQNYPANSPKMVEARTRLKQRDNLLSSLYIEGP